MSLDLSCMKLADKEQPDKLYCYNALGETFYTTADKNGVRRTWVVPCDSGMYQATDDDGTTPLNVLPPTAEPFGPLKEGQFLRTDGDHMDYYTVGHCTLGEMECGGVAGLEFASSLLTLADLFGLDLAKRILVANAYSYSNYTDVNVEDEKSMAQIQKTHQERSMVKRPPPSGPHLFEKDVLEDVCGVVGCMGNPVINTVEGSPGTFKGCPKWMRHNIDLCERHAGGDIGEFHDLIYFDNDTCEWREFPEEVIKASQTKREAEKSLKCAEAELRRVHKKYKIDNE